MTAQTKAFDPNMRSTTSDLWLAAVGTSARGSRAPLTINPGQSAVIQVTITPSGLNGTVVSGTLYVDDLTYGVPPYGQVSGDELAAIPYTYTIGAAKTGSGHHGR
jgi:hypothetical protein